MRTYSTRLLLPILLFCFTALAQEHKKYSQQDLNNELVVAANWMQHAPEYQALMYQGYNIATDQLPARLKAVPKGKKPAIIVDIDDTLLKGTPFFSSMVGSEETLTVERSKKWWHDCAKNQVVIPGAIDFIRYASSLGIEVFYISGRYHSVLEPTVQILKKSGFPVDSQHVLLQPPADRMLSKAERRESIEKKGFDVIMLLGDQLDDVTEPQGKLYSDHIRWVDQHKGLFGSQWVLFPNPLYGGWERALSENYHQLSPLEKHQLRSERLHISWHPHDALFQQHLIQAAIWHNFSATYQALCYQTYNQASWQLEQLGEAKPNQLTRAIVMDIDGSVLDVFNDFNALAITGNARNRHEKLLQTDNRVIRGAKAFLRKAQDAGFVIFYVTNRPTSSVGKRDCGDMIQSTLTNLQKEGIPYADEKHLLSRTCFATHPFTLSSKAARRQAIAEGRIDGKQYDIVFYVGDSLTDFDLEEQSLKVNDIASVDAIKKHLGRQYFLLPNVLNIPRIKAFHQIRAGDPILENRTPEELASIRINTLKGWDRPSSTPDSESAQKLFMIFFLRHNLSNETDVPQRYKP